MKSYSNYRILLHIFLFLVLGTFVFGFNNCYARTDLKTPTITSFEKSKAESNALVVSIKSNNTGSDYSFELLNVVTGKVNVLSGNTTSYTYQKLTNGTYKIQIRACSNDKNSYSCTNYSEVKSATLGSSEPAKPTKPTVKTVSLNRNVFNCTGYPINPVVTAIDSNGKKLKEKTDFKVTYPAGRTNIGTYVVTVKGIGNYSFEKKLTFKIVMPTPYIIRIQPYEDKIDVNSMDYIGIVKGFDGGNQISYKKASDKKWTTIKTIYGTIPDNWQKKPFKASTKYNIRIRNFAKVNNKIKYSSWSKTETIKTLSKKTKYNITTLTPVLDNYSYTYDGKNKKPVLTVTDYNTKAKLKKGTDYTATFPSSSKKVGTYTITVKGKGKYAKNYPQYLKYRIVKIVKDK